MINPSPHRRYRFTLTELLVVVFFAAILMAALMPWLNTVRESARRSQCTQSQKQLALAINNGVIGCMFTD